MRGARKGGGRGGSGSSIGEERKRGPGDCFEGKSSTSGAFSSKASGESRKSDGGRIFLTVFVAFLSNCCCCCSGVNENVTRREPDPGPGPDAEAGTFLWFVGVKNEPDIRFNGAGRAAAVAVVAAATAFGVFENMLENDSRRGATEGVAVIRGTRFRGSARGNSLPTPPTPPLSGRAVA